MTIGDLSNSMDVPIVIKMYLQMHLMIVSNVIIVFSLAPYGLSIFIRMIQCICEPNIILLPSTMTSGDLVLGPDCCFLIIDNHVKKRKCGNFVSISSLTGKCAAEKISNFCSSSLWTCLHHMVILRSQNKITNFLMILAWASPFNQLTVVTCLLPLSRLFVLSCRILPSRPSAM